jgi:hypothetical protein
VTFLRTPTPCPADPGRRRLAGWVVVCLWLLVALMPLRAWAAAQMGVAMADGPAAALAAAELPPCHAAEDTGGADAAGGHTACAQCLFCAPVLAAAAAAEAGPPEPSSPPPAARAGAAPEGATETLFKPPRG